MITGKEKIMIAYDEYPTHHMWKLYKGSDLIAIGESENEAINRHNLETTLERFDGSKYRLQIYPAKAGGGGDTSKHLKWEINTAAPGSPAHNTHVNGIGDIDSLVERRIGAVMGDKIELLRREYEIADLKKQLKEMDGVGQVTPWQKWAMETIGAFVPYVPALVTSITGKEVPPIKPAPQPQPNPQPRQAPPKPMAGEEVPEDIQRKRDRLAAVIHRMSEAAPDTWLDTLEKVGYKYAEKPHQLEQLLPMLETL